MHREPKQSSLTVSWMQKVNLTQIKYRKKSWFNSVATPKRTLDNLGILKAEGSYHEIFDLYYFLDSNPSGPLDKQGKLFSNSVSISPIYFITKLSPRYAAHCGVKIKVNFIQHRYVFPWKDMSDMSQRKAKILILTPRCAAGLRGVRVMHTAEIC